MVAKTPADRTANLIDVGDGPEFEIAWTSKIKDDHSNRDGRYHVATLRDGQWLIEDVAPTGAKLIGNTAVTDLVPALQIRDGAARPSAFPSIILGEGQTTLVGDRYATIRDVWAYLPIDVWAEEQGLASTKEIAGAVCDVLAPFARATVLDVPGFILPFGIGIESTLYMRDPSQQHGHGVVTVAAYMRCPT